MKSSHFVELFKSRIERLKSISLPLLLQRSIIDDVSQENYEDVKGRFAVKMITVCTSISDAVSALSAFDEIVREFVLMEPSEEGKVSDEGLRSRKFK